MNPKKFQTFGWWIYPDSVPLWASWLWDFDILNIIYDELKIHCQPIAINSGYVWPKKGKKSSNKNITISILEPRDAGLAKESFNTTLQEKIYSEHDKIN